MATVNHWIWLANCTLGQPILAHALLDYFGSVEHVYIADGYQNVPHLNKKIQERLMDKSMDEVEWILAQCDIHHLRILTFVDGDYPQRLREIEDPPIVLYVRGKLPRFDQEVAIGIVGARKPTEYGKRCAGMLAIELSRMGALVVTGMAQGIDASALLGALRVGCPVVSVVAGGIDNPYPKFHASLQEDVATMGAVISEFPPKSNHEGWHFPVRNRIISGLSLGVVAVECGTHSGTMVTIRKALEQNRDVFAVPGNIDNPLSEGPNGLIRQGAITVTSARDIIEEYALRFPAKVGSRPPLPRQVVDQRLSHPPETPPKTSSETPPETSSDTASASKKEGSKTKASGKEKISLDDPKWELSKDQKLLLAALEKKSCLMDDLVELTQLTVRRVSVALTLLQVKGLVVEGAGKRFESEVECDLSQ